jgi:hypothetical protein
MCNPEQIWKKFSYTVLTLSCDDFGGLVIGMLASGTQVRGFNPGRSRWIFLLCGKNPQA